VRVPVRIVGWPAVAALVVLSAVVRGWAGTMVHGPWISPDETVYALLGQGLYRHGSLEILGGPTPFYSLVVPALVGPFLSLGDLELGYTLLKPFLALVMSLAAVPVYLWARPLAGRGWALVAAALTVAAPGLAYSGLVMSEVAFYPAMTLAAWAIARAIAAPSPRSLALLAFAVALALATRLQALILLPVSVAAVVLDAIFARSWRRLREGVPVVAAAFVPGVAWLIVQQTRGEPLLGAYESTAAASFHAADSARYVLYHAGTLVLTVGVIPVCALLALALAATMREESAPFRATIATTLALTGGVVGQVGVFASQHVGQIAERDMLCVVPSLFVCLALWLGDARARDFRTSVVAGTAALILVAVVPFGTFVTEQALPDAITFAPLWHLELATSGGTIRVVVLLAAIGAAAMFVFVPRERIVVVPALLLVLAVAGSVVASREVIHQASGTRTALVGSDPRWVDSARSFGDATIVYDGGRDWPEVWQALFWNRRIHHVATLGGEVLPGPVPQSDLELRPSGMIDVSDREIVTPSTFQAEGSLIAFTTQAIPSHGGLRLWELTKPPRMISRAIGLQANGDVYGNRHATLLVYGCTKGTWILSLLIKGPPQNVVLSQDGRVLQRERFTSDFWNGNVAIAARPGAQTCRLGITSTDVVGTTRFDFVPAS
jgi:4-amino-4-deoxy-L-arabinose transferase-like glycosyltransferase